MNHAQGQTYWPKFPWPWLLLLIELKNGESFQAILPGTDILNPRPETVYSVKHSRDHWLLKDRAIKLDYSKIEAVYVLGASRRKGKAHAPTAETVDDCRSSQGREETTPRALL